MFYKVFIPSAGLGSRLGDETNFVNKALVSIAGKPCLAHIIDKFPKEIEIVIGLGYKADLIRQFVEHVYGGRNIKFVDVVPYEGPNSGLGRTLLECKKHLNCPFIFCPNDTIVSEEIPPPSRNWMGYAKRESTDQYRGLVVTENNDVAEICSKGASVLANPYIGLAGIHDHQRFWEEMEQGTKVGSIEIGESYGLKQMLATGIKAVNFTWYDTGSPSALEVTRATLQKNSEYNILDKSGEAIWFIDNKVVKYSSDEDFVRNRTERAKTLEGYVPRLLSSTKNMYSYRLIPGTVFSKEVTRPRFEYLLKWLDGFWKPCKLSHDQEKFFKSTCLEFYKDKTNKRIDQYLKRFEQLDSDDIINGSAIQPLGVLLNEVNWSDVADGVAVRFHGDLHFENILVPSDGSAAFSLLDWRQDFGGIIEYGDIYYDFAKLLHGLIISHEMVKTEQFQIQQRLNEIQFDFHRKQSLLECEFLLQKHASSKNLSWKRIQLITALIFINIAPLHHYPYSKLLFYLGKKMLSQSLNT